MERLARIGRWLGRDPYLVFAVIIFAGLAYFVIIQPWHIDLGMHLATIVRWDHDFADPRNPLIDVPGPSPYYSPFMLVWVLLVKIFGLTQFTVLKIAAAVNVVLFLVGIRLFVGSFTRSAAASMISFAAMVLVWGVLPTLWSGLFPLATLVITLPFPSTFATGCTLILFGLVRRAAAEQRTDLPRLAWIVLLAAMIILSHPITAAAAALGVVIIVIGPLVRARSLRGLLIWAGVGLAAVLVAVPWPWFRITDLLASPTGLDELHATLYEDPWRRYGLLLFTLPALIARFRRDRLDPLPLLAVINIAVVIIGYVTGHYALARMITWAGFAAQIAAALELCHALNHLRQQRFRLGRLLVIISTLAGLVIGGYSQLGIARVFWPELTRGWPEAIDAPYELWQRYDWATRQMAYGDVVLTDESHALRMIPAYGMYTVAPAYPDPLLPPAQPVRDAVTEEFLDDDDTSWSRRTEIIRQYGVDWVLATEEDWHAPDGPRAGVDYELVAEGPDDQRLYRVRAEAGG